jgi:hypothetical protein
VLKWNNKNKTKDGMNGRVIFDESWDRCVETTRPKLANICLLFNNSKWTKMNCYWQRVFFWASQSIRLLLKTIAIILRVRMWWTCVMWCDDHLEYENIVFSVT